MKVPRGILHIYVGTWRYCAWIWFGDVNSVWQKHMRLAPTNQRPQFDQTYTTCLCITGNINIAIYARFNCDSTLPSSMYLRNFCPCLFCPGQLHWHCTDNRRRHRRSAPPYTTAKFTNATPPYVPFELFWFLAQCIQVSSHRRGPIVFSNS